MSKITRAALITAIANQAGAEVSDVVDTTYFDYAPDGSSNALGFDMLDCVELGLEIEELTDEDNNFDERLADGSIATVADLVAAVKAAGQLEDE